MIDNNNNGVLPNEITTIRDILVGPQMQQFTQRIKDLETRIEELELLERKFTNNALSQKEEIINSLSNQIQDTHKSWDEKLGAVEQRLVTQRQMDKSELGKLLIDLGQKFIQESA